MFPRASTSSGELQARMRLAEISVSAWRASMSDIGFLSRAEV